MRLEGDAQDVRVFLSERNLRALLAKVTGAPSNSACTIIYRTADNRKLTVTAEPDAIHYANPERDTPQPGPMVPETEKRIASDVECERLKAGMRALRLQWLEENDPKDGTDCVTPFDEYLY